MIKVFILNAGKGTRLLPFTKKIPKCLVQINKKDTILSLQLKALKKAGLRNIYILTGYKHITLKKYVIKLKTGLNIHFHFFPFFEEGSNLMTLWSARKLFGNDIIIINGDNVFDWKILTKLRKSRNSFGTILANKKMNYDDDDMLIVEKNSILTRVNKNLSKKTASSESIGIMRFWGNGVKQLVKVMDSIIIDNDKAKKLWYLYAVDKLAKSSHKIKVNYIEKLYWAEVDFPKDLKFVRNTYQNELTIPNLKTLYKTYSKNFLVKKGPNVDELWYSRIIGRKISIYFTWMFLHTKINPNQITLISLLFGFISAFLIAIPNIVSLLLGVFVFQLYIILDSSDGEIARITNQCSILGKYLDKILHVGVYSFLYVGLGVNIYLRTLDLRGIIIGLTTSLLLSISSMVFFLDPLLSKMSYAEIKKNDSKYINFANFIYNLITGDIEIVLLLGLIAPLLYKDIIKIDVFLLILIVNSCLLFCGGIFFSVLRKFYDSRYSKKS